MCYSSTDRILGLLAHTMGDLELALRHFETAVGFCRKAGYRPELSLSCCDYAEGLLKSGNADDYQKAVSLIDEALTISGKLGMRPLMERASVIKERAGSIQVPVRAPTYPDGLSVREVEVLRLIASGLSNREISLGLVLSIRTAERHITNIYGKTNGRGRADATSYALRHGLLEDK